MSINRYVFLFLLSILLTCCYSQVFIDVPNDYLFRFKRTVELSTPEIKLDFEIEPGSYFLRIKHPVQLGQKKIISFNKQSISPFYIRKSDTRKKGSFCNETAYFHIKPSQIQKNNFLNIKFDSAFPPYVTIYLQNFRKSFYSDKIITFFKPVSFSTFAFKTWIIAAVFIYGFLIIMFLFFNRVFKRAIPWVLIFLCIAIIIFGLFAINNFLPFSPYLIFFKPFYFWFYLLSAPFVLFLLVKRKRDRITEDLHNDILFFSIKHNFIIPSFLGLLTILFVLRFVGALQYRVPMGHDTFQYMLLQYNLFFNEPALRGSIPRWLPFMTHGTLSHIWVLISQGLLISILVPFVKFLKHINFFYIFQAGLLFDELVLLLGCILLAKRFFKSTATIVFVASSVTFTAISSTQIWYDFHLVYLLPLTLYCFTRALQDVSAKYIFLAGLFSTGMLLGNLPYYPPLFGFTILVFCLMLFFCVRSPALDALKNFKSCFDWRHALVILIPCLSAILIFLFMKRGVEEIISCNVGRSDNFAVQGIENFLNYGGYINIRKYWGLINRCSNNIDNTVYGGLLLVPFIVLTLLRVRSRLSYTFGVTAFIMALFSAGIGVPLIFYYLVPLGKYYRHIGLVVPLVKLFAVFYAGFGFDAFWHSLRRLRNNFSQDIFAEDKANLLIVCVVMIYIFALVLVQRFVNLPVFDFSSWAFVTESQLYVSIAQISRGMNQLLIISGLFIILMLVMLRWPRQAIAIGVVFISVHLIDLVPFKFEREYQRVPRVNKDVMSLFNTYDYSFSDTRNQDYFSNDRFLKLVPYIFTDEWPFNTNEPHQPVGRYGAVYWDTESFLFFDATSSIFNTRHLLKGIDDCYRIFISPSRWKELSVGFPIPQATAFKKLSGYDFPKLQLFSKIHILPTENDVAEVLANPHFEGDMLIASGIDSKLTGINTPLIFESKENICLHTNDRVSNAELKVQEFTFNKLRVLVNNRSGDNAVLYYADAWHPRWHAYVDGNPVFILKTNIGYKSIIIPPGQSKITFTFGDTICKLLFNGLIAIGICVFCGVIYLVFLELRNRDEGKMVA